jgi:hypothetical protein
MPTDGIPGITILGSIGMFGDGTITTDPVYLSAEYIERGIASGTLRAGAFNRVNVSPPVGQWPPEWRFLKDSDGG